MDQNIEFESLAATAELSLYHFARTFEQSEGATPHTFVLERRLARARELLTRTVLQIHPKGLKREPNIDIGAFLIPTWTILRE
jgi:transcriptional regulator GlxA family with amidase domain